MASPGAREDTEIGRNLLFEVPANSATTPGLKHQGNVGRLARQLCERHGSIVGPHLAAAEIVSEQDFTGLPAGPQAAVTRYWRFPATSPKFRIGSASPLEAGVPNPARRDRNPL